MKSTQHNHFFQKALVGFFQLLYHSLAWAYDLVAWTVSLGRWNHWVAQAADELTGNRILELGFGPGQLQQLLSQRGTQCFGIDESQQMNLKAARRLTRQGAHPRLTRGKTQNLPFSSSTFDSVVATFPSPYIFHPQTLSEIHRVLTTQGKITVLLSAVAPTNSITGILVNALFRLTGQATPQPQDAIRLKQPFEAAGFTADLVYRNTRSGTLFFILATKC